MGIKQQSLRACQTHNAHPSRQCVCYRIDALAASLPCSVTIGNANDSRRRVQTVKKLFKFCFANLLGALRDAPALSSLEAFSLSSMRTFKIPASPDDLLYVSDDSALSVQQNTAVAELKPEEAQQFADGVAWCPDH